MVKKRSPEELVIVYKWLFYIMIIGFIVGGIIILMGKIIPSFGEWIARNIWLFISVLVLAYAIGGFAVGVYLERKLNKEV